MIALLEDDDSIRKLVTYALSQQGFEAEGYAVPSALYAAVEKRTPELLLLDISLPEEDGISVLRKLRSRSETRHLPIILLTAKNTEYDRVIGLDNGADDFISKPFSMMELLARVRAVLRRTSVLKTDSTLMLGSLTVYPERREAQVSGETIPLTCKEFDLLCLLLQNEGRVLTRSVLMDRIWGCELSRENRTLDVHVRTLRQKLGQAGTCIETVRGVGYRAFL